MVNRHMKRCSTLLIIGQMQVKTTTKHDLMQIGMAITKGLQITNVGEGVEKGEPS